MQIIAKKRSLFKETIGYSDKVLLKKTAEIAQINESMWQFASQITLDWVENSVWLRLGNKPSQTHLHFISALQMFCVKGCGIDTQTKLH